MINYNAALPAPALSGRRSLDINQWMDGFKGTFNAVMRRLFASGVQGFWYDPNDLATMFQDKNGINQVTQAGQPVGLILDKSKPIGKELAVNGSFKDGATGWTLSGTAKLTSQGVRITGFGADGVLKQAVTCEVGKTYLLTAKISVEKGGVTNSTGPASQFNGTRVFTATSTSHELNFRCFGNSTDTDFTITDISFCEISSNYAYQNTSASRPILRQNAITGAYYLEFDGTDDFLQTNPIDFSSTDRASIFTAVNKLSDADSALVVELSDGTASSLNAFALFAPSASGVYKFDMRNVVSGVGAYTNNSKYAAPYSAVVTGFVTPGLSSKKAELRVNGESVAHTTTGRSGKMVSAPVYIGRRAGTTLPFTGHIYGLMGAGKVPSNDDVKKVEQHFSEYLGVALSA